MARTVNNLIQRSAAQWFARLQDPGVSVDEMLAWQRWMRADTRHALAFQGMEEAWQALEHASAERIEALSRAHTSAPTRFMSPLPLALAACLLCIAVALTLTLWQRPLVLQTAIGENRTYPLTDGSRLTLGGDTRVEVRFTDTQRHLKLKHGEALFTVAPDIQRPFIVRAGNATVTATGTAFNIRRRNDRTLIAVVEGKVRVEPESLLAPVDWLRTDQAARHPVELDAGQQTTVQRSEVLTAVHLDNPAAITAWQRGLLSFHGEPLRYALQDVNRYTPKPIVAGSPEVGEIRITGTVMSDKVGEWIDSLEHAFGLHAAEESERIVLLQKRADRSHMPP